MARAYWVILGGSVSRWTTPSAARVMLTPGGVNLRELMERMGHSTSRAALIYLHSTSDRQHTRADAVAAHVRVRTRQAGRMPNDAVARREGHLRWRTITGSLLTS